MKALRASLGDCENCLHLCFSPAALLSSLVVTGALQNISLENRVLLLKGGWTPLD